MELVSLNLVLTAECNLRCRYCYARGQRRSAVTWPVLQGALERLLPVASSHLEVGFTGGEPLLAFPMLQRAVEYLERARPGGPRVRFRVVTNGLLLDDVALSFFDAHRFRVSVSFDGVASAQALRGPSTFRRLDGLLGRLRRGYPDLWRRRLRVAITLSPGSVSSFASSVEYFLRKGVQTLTITPASGSWDWDPSRIDELDRQFERASAAVRGFYQRTGRVPVANLRRSLKPGERACPELACMAAQGGNVAVDVNGQAYGCLLACPSYQGGQTAAALRPAVDVLAMGDAASPAFAARRAAMAGAARAIGAFMHADRRYSSYGRCADCDYLGRCVACPLALATDPLCRDPLKVPDFTCAFNQVALRHRDRFPPQFTIGDAFEEARQLAARRSSLRRR